MSSSSSSSSGGIGFFGLLTIVFVTLKLTGFIDWSWWLVLLPLYGSIAFFLIFAVIALVIAFFVAKQEVEIKRHIRRLDRF
jgi:hypothetical protein